MSKLSNLEQDALDWLKHQGGSVLVTRVPDKTVQGVFGLEPGLTIYKKLAKKGYVFFTEEEPIQMPDGEWIEFTPSIYLREENDDN